jgi:hypothetical protein
MLDRPHSRLSVAAPYALLTVLNVLFRVPALLQPRGVQSDAAVVGLQAMHILRGEVSKFLWGTSYQSSFDAAVAAALFAVGGPTPLMLMLSALLGHLLLTGFAYATLEPRVGPLKATLLCLILVFAPQAINNISLYPPRQWCLTFLFAAVWLIDRQRPVAVFLGVVTAALAIWLDLYALQLAVPLTALALATDWRRTLPAVALGMLALWVLRQPHHAIASVGHLDLTHLAFNADLLWHTCLPMILSAKVFNPEEWPAPPPFHAWQVTGAVLLVLGLASGGPLLFARRIPLEARKLGLLGLAVAAASVSGFLLSSMPVDRWAARYLSPMVWFAPFALAPLAQVLNPRGLVVFVPYLTSAAVGGWLTFAAEPPDERPLADFLRAHHVRYATAEYWLAYRLTFLFGEDPIITPLEGARYPPYRDAFERQTDLVVYLANPAESVTPQALLASLHAPKETLEVHQVAGYTVILRHLGAH